MKTGIRLTLLAAGLAACAFAAQAQNKPSAAPSAPASAAAPAGAGDILRNPEYEKAGAFAAQAWLLLLDRKDWGTAWDTSSAVFRKNVPLDRWMDNIPKLRDPLGAFVERQPGDPIYTKRLPGQPEADYVTVSFRSKFANRQVIEMVTTVRESDGRWRVMGYGTQNQ